eukprot:1159002-Pelagomonas_calceolata.AAC.1
MQALQRGLPRPLTLDLLPHGRPAHEQPKLSLRERAEDMLKEEMLTVLAHDASKYPIVIKEGKK